MPSTWYQELKTILAEQPKYRRTQVEKAWFDPAVHGYDQITTLPLALREKLKIKFQSTVPCILFAPSEFLINVIIKSIV